MSVYLVAALNLRYSYQPGGWGKPPVDEQGNPLYGDVFGVNEEEEDQDAEPIDRTKWGELVESEEEEVCPSTEIRVLSTM